MIETKDLELVVQKQIPGELLTNARQIREFVQERVKDYSPEKYVGKVKEAKDDRATLNKAAKDLNGKRLELERQFMAPFQEFKDVITETVTAIKEASDKLGGVISEVEQKEKDERKEAIFKEYYASGFDLVPFDHLMDSRWLNKSTSDKQWKAELAEKIKKIKTDLDSLDSVGEDAETVKAFYLDTLDIGRALQHGQQLKQRREALQKASAPAEPQKPAEPEPKEPEAPEASAVETKPAEKEPDSVTLKLYGTREQLVALRQYIDSNGIRYEKL